MLWNVCKCMCTELKADLMGSGELQPSRGSVTYHQTLGSHDGLIIWGIVCSLSIIKTNQRRAACCQAVIQPVCLFVCLHAVVFVFICLNSEHCYERVQPNFKLSTHWKMTSEKTLSERTFTNISNIYLKRYSTSMECVSRMNPCLVSVESKEHLLDNKKDISRLLCGVLSKEIIASVFCRLVISKTTITSSIVGPSKGQLCPAVVATASSPWNPR